MGTLANGEDTDENGAFHQGLYCLPRQNQTSEKEKYFFEIITYGPSLYTMDHTDYFVCSFMGNSIGLKCKCI